MPYRHALPWHKIQYVEHPCQVDRLELFLRRNSLPKGTFLLQMGDRSVILGFLLGYAHPPIPHFSFVFASEKTFFFDSIGSFTDIIVLFFCWKFILKIERRRVREVIYVMTR
jgi:hypothetical protein